MYKLLLLLVCFRSKLLRAIIISAKYTVWLKNDSALIEGPGWIRWSHEMLRVVKSLLEGGADPKWSSGNEENNSLSDISALIVFFRSVIHIVSLHDDLYDDVIHLVELLLTEENLELVETRGTILHALVGTTWEQMPSQLPPTFVSRYTDIIEMVVNRKKTLLDSKDHRGKIGRAHV